MYPWCESKRYELELTRRSLDQVAVGTLDLDACAGRLELFVPPEGEQLGGAVWLDEERPA